MKVGHFITAPLASGMAALSIIATQGMTGRESAGALLLGYSVGWCFLFGVAAALPMLFTRTGHESLVAAFVSFGAGGGAAGGLIAGLLILHKLGGSPTAVMLDFAIPFTLPWIVGLVLAYFGCLRRQASGDRPTDSSSPMNV